MAPALMQRFRVETSTSPLSKYSSIASLSTESAVSSSSWRASATFSAMSAGIASSWNLAPSSPPSQTIAFISTRSTTPMKPSSMPIGSCSGSATMSSFSFSVSKAR